MWRWFCGIGLRGTLPVSNAKAYQKTNQKIGKISKYIAIILGPIYIPIISLIILAYILAYIRPYIYPPYI